MSDNTKIEWTEATWNPITGCSVTSPGCANCYAMRLAGTRLRDHPSRTGLTQDTKAGPVWTGKVRFNEQWLDQPLRWKRPRMIFVCAHGDLFHESVPDEWIDRVFAVMALCPQHTFQVLTKRSARMREYLSHPFVLNRVAVAALDSKNWPERRQGTTFGSVANGRREPATLQNIWPLPNVWLGVSVEDQQRADERVPDLLATPAAVRWLSCEPLLGPVDLTRVRPPNCTWLDALEGREHIGPAVVEAVAKIDWIVAGGESGPGARPMHPEWARALRDQCAAAGVPFFFKQWGSWTPVEDSAFTHWLSLEGRLTPAEYALPAPTDYTMARVGKKAAGRLLDERTHDAMPGFGG
jgi:protein gp37